MNSQQSRFVLATLVLIGALILVGTTSYASEGQIGIVNVQEVFNNHPGLEKAQAEYQESAAAYQEELATLSEEQQQAALQQYQQELQALEGEIQQRLLTDIRAAVRQVAEELGLSLVVDEGVVFFGGEDITPLVIDALK